MKIGLILQAGYRLIRYKGKPVTKTSVDLEHGVINKKGLRRVLQFNGITALKALQEHYHLYLK